MMAMGEGPPPIPHHHPGQGRIHPTHQGKRDKDQTPEDLPFTNLKGETSRKQYNKHSTRQLGLEFIAGGHMDTEIQRGERWAMGSYSESYRGCQEAEVRMGSAR